MRDIASRFNVRPAFNPVAAVTDNTVQTSAIIDTAGYEGVALVLQTGTLSDADATFAVTIEHGDQANLSDAAAAATADLTGTLANASFDFGADNACRKIGYVGSKRYIRAKVTPANNTGNLFLAGTWLLMGGRFNPQPALPA